MRALSCLVGMLMMVSPAAISAQGWGQTDWSGGPSEEPAVPAWSNGFVSEQGVSWLAVPGQLVTASVASVSVEHSVTTGFNGGCSLDACDLDADGDTDLLGSAHLVGETAWWSNDGGDPIQWTKNILETGHPSQIAVHACDLDQDGDWDVVGANYLDGEIFWWSNGGDDPITWSRHQVTSEFQGIHHIVTGDMDGDGREDIVGCSQEGDKIAWWHNEGGSPLTWSAELTIETGFTMASSVAVSDIDGDGDQDVMAASLSVPGKITWWSNEGGQPIAWTRQAVTTNFSYAHWVHTCDLDKDGDFDILGAAYIADDVTWWRNEGGDPVVWTRHDIDTDFDGALTTSAADFDGDGDLDVIAAAKFANSITWWENEDGAATLWIEHTVSSSFGQAWVCLPTDLDGDGDVDVAGTAETGGRIDWWEVSSFTASGNLISSILDTETSSWQGSFDWEAVYPEGSSVSVRVRSGTDPATLGPWSAALTEPGSLPDELSRYVQYELMLERGSGPDSPLVRSVTLQQSGVSAVPPNRQSSLLHLLPNRPNPFNPLTTISYEVDRATHVALSVYDLHGHEIARLVDENQHPGRYDVPFNGSGLASGAYFVGLTGDSSQQVGKILLVK